MTATQFKEYTEAVAENKILHKKIEKLEQDLTSRKREISKLKVIIDDLVWGSS
jgi:hemerythrin superfamily protein